MTRAPHYTEDRRRRSAQTPPPRQADWVRVDGGRHEWDATHTDTDTDTDTGAPPRRTRRAPVATVATRARDASPGTRSGTGTGHPRLSGRKTLPPEVAAAVRNAAADNGAPQIHREHLVERTELAYAAYERGRYQEALRSIKPVADEAPGVPAVRELAGFAAYRSARWRDAQRHLQAFGELSDSTDHLPVLMDTQRALGKPKKVAERWSELRHSSPEPDVLAEGRIVAAASLADGGDLSGAIALLAAAGASKSLRNPSGRHIRQWYLLADLYERAGDVPRAREFFERVQRADPEAYDVAERLRSLGPERPRRSKPKSATKTSRPAGTPRSRSGRAPAKATSRTAAPQTRRPNRPS
jgi:tetratricopeptide (TPR) repeat protein